MVIHWCGSVKMRISTENNRKFLYSSSAILPHRTRGPVYRRNCLNSVAFHQLTSAIVLGFLATSIGIDFLKISKKSVIFCCTFPPILTFSGPDIQSKMNLFMTPRTQGAYSQLEID